MPNSVLNEYSQNIVIGIATSFEISHDVSWKEITAKFIHDIWLIKKGKVYIEQNGEKILLEQGDIFMHRPSKLYTAYTDEEGCEFIYTTFDIKLWGENIDTSGLNIYGKFPANDIKSEYDIYTDIHKLYKQGRYMSGLMMKAALELMIGRLIYLSKSRAASAVVQSPVKDKGSRIEAVLKYISENTSKRLTVKQIAENAGMSEKYFISYFRKAIGESPYSYITGTKMQAAYNHLATGKYHVYEVADMLGYSDIYTFSKAFKKYFGKSPSKVFSEMRQ